MCQADDKYQSNFFLPLVCNTQSLSVFFGTLELQLQISKLLALDILTNVKYSFLKKIVHYYPKMKYLMILLFVTYAYSGGPFQEQENSRCNMDFLRIAHNQAEQCIRDACENHPVVIPGLLQDISFIIAILYYFTSLN